ncbi:MAG: PSP1 domain-containing protein [Luteibaculum sp.]
MACTNCSKGGIPAGCKGNGQCGTYGCNSLDVFDWLADVKLPEGKSPFDLVEIRFKGTRKAFYRNTKNYHFSVGDVVVVEGSPGYDVGLVSLTGELVRIQMQRKGEKTDNYEIKKILRKANQEDIDLCHEARKLEESTMLRSREIARELSLHMKISDVEYQGDKTKATFYYTADDRVDFRELIKRLADEFSIRVEMRQIGSRQEASRVGGIGSCGRELCCTTWLTDFRTVSTSAARYQQLSLNPQKLAGQCGKLKCCLNYELDMYVEAIREFPKTDVKLKTRKGVAEHFKTDIFKKLIWYSYYEDGKSGDPIPIPLSRATEIISMNEKGEKPDDLKSFQFIEPVEETQKIDFTDAMGTESLNRFDQKKKGKGKGKKGRKGPRQAQGQAQGANQGRDNQRKGNRNRGNRKRPNS